MAYQPDRDHALSDFQVGKWRVHLVDEGIHKGYDNCRVVEKADLGDAGLPFVEFYDTTQDPVKFPGGQFVSRYYMETLLGLKDPKDSLTFIAADDRRFGLYGGVPAWTLSNAETMLVGIKLEELASTEYKDRLKDFALSESFLSLTLDEIATAMDRGIIQLIQSPYDHDTVCSIGSKDEWFYFGNSEVKGLTAAELHQKYEPRDLAVMISAAMDGLDNDDWSYYTSSVREQLVHSESPSLKEACEQAKQASAALNSQIKNQPIKTQEAR